MTLTEQIIYYRNLLIVQYANKAKAKATVEAFAIEAVADQLMNQLFDGFDLDTAVGMQLDILAAYRGISRYITGLDFGRAYFTLPLYTDADAATRHGFPSYDDPNPSWYWARYEDTNRPTYSMNDDELRRLIKFVASWHSSSLGVGEIDAILYNTFGPNVTLTDNFDMTMGYTRVTDNGDHLYSIIVALGLFPKPAGVHRTTTP